MNDAAPGRDDADSAEGPLRPAQEREPLAISLELEPGVRRERVGPTEAVHVDRVVDDEVRGHPRVDGRRRASALAHGVTEGGQIHQHRNTGEVLEEHARRAECDLAWGRRKGIPERQDLHILLADAPPVDVPKQVLQEDTDRERQPREAHAEVDTQGGKAPVLVPPAFARELATSAHIEGRPVQDHAIKAGENSRDLPLVRHLFRADPEQQGGDVRVVALHRVGVLQVLLERRLFCLEIGYEPLPVRPGVGRARFACGRPAAEALDGPAEPTGVLLLTGRDLVEARS